MIELWKGQVMRIRLVLLGCVACIVVLAGQTLSGGAKTAVQTPEGGSSIAVVRIMEVLQEQSEADKVHQQEMTAERGNARAEMEQRAKQIGTEEADLNTLKAGSADYLKQLDEVLKMKALLQSRKEFLERQLSLKQQVWTRNTYADAMRIIGDIAAERGFRLVLAADQVDLPMSEAMVNVIALQKVLYSRGCPDITDEVKSRLGQGKPPTE